MKHGLKALLVSSICVILLMLISFPVVYGYTEISGGRAFSASGNSGVQGIVSPSGTATFIINPGTGTVSSAVSNSLNGDKFLLLKGTYFDNVEIDRSLSIKGVGEKNSVVDGQQAGSVFTIKPGAIVTLKDMTIQHGNAPLGGGIINGGILTLDGVLITDNTAYDGGGILNLNTVNIDFGSSITDNTATGISEDFGKGGGILNGIGATVNMNHGSSISRNKADNGGGIWISKGGLVNMNSESTIKGNMAYVGGGIVNYGGTVNMNSGSSITGNLANEGAGIENDVNSVINMYKGSSISDNIAAVGKGGGIANYGGTVNLYAGSSIGRNIAVLGGGIYSVGGVVTMDGGSISHNKALGFPTAPGRGGGILSEYSVLNLISGSISGNEASHVGGGVWNGGVMTMGSGMSIFDNTAGLGGGVYNHFGYINMQSGSSILGNAATGFTDGTGEFHQGRGGGIFNLEAPNSEYTLEFFDANGNPIPGYDPIFNDDLHFFGPKPSRPDNKPDDVYNTLTEDSET